MEKILYFDLQDVFDLEVISQFIIQGKEVCSLGEEIRRNDIFVKIDRLSDIPKKKQLILCLDRIHFINRNQIREQFEEKSVSVWFSESIFSKVRHYDPHSTAKILVNNQRADREIEKLRIFLEKIKEILELTDLNYICSAYSEEDSGDIMKMFQSLDIPSRIYRIPLLTQDVKNGLVDPCERFTYWLLYFVSWIELRIPEYFRTHRLSVVTDKKLSLNILDKDKIVNNILLCYDKHNSKDNKEQMAEYCILNYQDTPVDDFIQSIVKSVSNVSGKNFDFIRVTDDSKELNFIDLMFYKLIRFYLPFFANHTSFDDHKYGKGAQINYVMAADQEKHYRLIAEHLLAEKKRFDVIGVSRRRKSVTINESQKLVYYTSGSGEPILIINAFGAYVEAWDRLIFELSKKYYIIIWEIRGVIEGTKELFEKEEFGVSSQVRDIERIVAYENLDCFHMLAWCSGMKSAAIYTSKHPDKVKSLIFLAGDYAPYRGIENNYSKFRDNISLIEEIINEKPHMLKIYMQLIFGGLFRTPSVDLSDDIETIFFEILPTIYRDKLLTLFQSQDQTVNFLRICMEYYNHDVSDVLSSLTQPVTIISAEYDQVASSDQSLWAHGIIRHSTYYCIPCATHLLMLERTGDVMRCIEEHMERLCPTCFTSHS